VNRFKWICEKITVNQLYEESYDKKQCKSNKSLEALMVDDGSKIYAVNWNAFLGIIKDISSI